MQDEQYRGQGTTDGTFRDMRYFHCEDKCGLFVALDKLSMDREGNTLEAEPRGGQSYAKAVSHGTTVSSRSCRQNSGPPADNTRARSQRPLPRFKTGDRVVAFDKTGNRIHGTVRWVGMIDKVQHFVVGIETVSSVVLAMFQAPPSLCLCTHCQYFSVTRYVCRQS